MSPKGRPDAVPVWFWWDGDNVYFTCKANTTKPRNIAHEPNVVLHNGDGADPIIVKGVAERAVKADIALWPMRIVASGTELAPTQEKIAADQKTVREFFRRAGARKDLQTADAGAAHGDRQHADAARAIASVAMRSNDADPS